MSENPRFSDCMAAVIRKHRTARGLSQNQLSKISKVSQTYISALERGLYEPTVLILLQIAKALKVELWKLIREAERQSQG
ncbi:MAG TPA: helix-turn-helix transcriptional regulator [Candidatus Angelobacter sp.]|nr:helix-turn-helix transcriptional regulator [Candidatus Angelobacter sp.]